MSSPEPTRTHTGLVLLLLIAAIGGLVSPWDALQSRRQLAAAIPSEMAESSIDGRRGSAAVALASPRGPAVEPTDTQPTRTRSATTVGARVRFHGFLDSDRLALAWRDAGGRALGYWTELQPQMMLEGLAPGAGEFRLEFRAPVMADPLDRVEAVLAEDQVVEIDLVWPQPTSVEPGSLNVLIVLDDVAAELSSRVDLTLELWAHGDSDAQRRAGFRPLDVALSGLSTAGAGAYVARFEDLPPGTYRVSIEPLGAAQDVALASGASQDTRLELGPLAHSIVTLAGLDGRPRRPVRVRFEARPEGLASVTAIGAFKTAWSEDIGEGVYEVWSAPGELSIHAAFEVGDLQLQRDRVVAGWNDLRVEQEERYVVKVMLAEPLELARLAEVRLSCPAGARLLSKSLGRRVGEANGAFLRLMVSRPGNYMLHVPDSPDGQPLALHVDASRTTTIAQVP